MSHDVAVVGTAPGGEGDSAEAGYETTEYSPASRGYVHATHFDALASCSVVACADLVEAHAAAFADAFGLPADRAYTDHGELLAAVRPEVVTVCTPPTARPGIDEDPLAAMVEAGEIRPDS